MYGWPFKKYTLGTAYGAKGSLWKCGWHSGQDFFSTSAGGDGKIYPIEAGTVSYLRTDDPSYGKTVRVSHPDGHISLYAHLKTIDVAVNQRVTAGTVLGIEGSTGNSTATHLHLEIHKGAYSYPAQIDPKKFIEERMSAVAKENTSTPSDWAKGYWEKACTTIGTDGMPILDGTNPQGALTREQLAAVLVRLGVIK